MTRCAQPENTAHQKMTGRRMSHCPNCGTVRRRRTRRNFEAIVVVMAEFVGHGRDGQISSQVLICSKYRIGNMSRTKTSHFAGRSKVQGIVQRSSSIRGALPRKVRAKKRSWQAATLAVERCLGDSRVSSRDNISTLIQTTRKGVVAFDRMTVSVAKVEILQSSCAH